MCVCSYEHTHINTHMGVLIQTPDYDTLLHPTTTYNTFPYCTLLHPTTPLITATVIPLPPSSSAAAAASSRCCHWPFLSADRPLSLSAARFLGIPMHPPSLRNVLATCLSRAPHPQPPQREQREGARGRRGGGHTRDQVRGLAEEVRWSINCGAVASGLFGTCPRRTVYLFTAFSLV